MKRSVPAVLMLVMAILSVAVPQKAFAAVSCTDQYVVCLNDASKYEGVLQSMAETECGFAYTGCVARKLKFW